MNMKYFNEILSKKHQVIYSIISVSNKKMDRKNKETNILVLNMVPLHTEMMDEIYVILYIYTHIHI